MHLGVGEPILGGLCGAYRRLHWAYWVADEYKDLERGAAMLGVGPHGCVIAAVSEEAVVFGGAVALASIRAGQQAYNSSEGHPSATNY